MKARILVVEDQQDISEVIVAYLEREGFGCEAVSDGLTALRRWQEAAFDLLVLDWMLPGLDGLSFCRQLRAEGRQVPILVVSARGKDEERVEGLSAGADDFLPKPFHPRELVARVRALLRRRAAPRRQFGELTVDPEQRQAWLRDQPLELTPTELSLLLTLAAHPDVTLSRQRLLDLVWGPDFPGSERTVDSHMRSLRARLGPGQSWIESVWGVGYRFNPQSNR